MSKQSYESDIILGERYVDDQTGYQGTATAVYFFQHACERVTLEAYDETTKKVIETTFDAPRLRSLKTKQVAQSDRPGGPVREVGVRPGPQ